MIGYFSLTNFSEYTILMKKQKQDTDFLRNIYNSGYKVPYMNH